MSDRIEEKGSAELQSLFLHSNLIPFLWIQSDRIRQQGIRVRRVMNT